MREIDWSLSVIKRKESRAFQLAEGRTEIVGHDLLTDEKSEQTIGLLDKGLGKFW